MRTRQYNEITNSLQGTVLWILCVWMVVVKTKQKSRHFSNLVLKVGRKETAIFGWWPRKPFRVAPAYLPNFTSRHPPVLHGPTPSGQPPCFQSECSALTRQTPERLQGRRPPAPGRYRSGTASFDPVPAVQSVSPRPAVLDVDRDWASFISLPKTRSPSIVCGVNGTVTTGALNTTLQTAGPSALPGAG